MTCATCADVAAATASGWGGDCAGAAKAPPELGPVPGLPPRLELRPVPAPRAAIRRALAPGRRTAPEPGGLDRGRGLRRSLGLGLDRRRHGVARIASEARIAPGPRPGPGIAPELVTPPEPGLRSGPGAALGPGTATEPEPGPRHRRRDKRVRQTCAFSPHLADARLLTRPQNGEVF